MIKLVQKFLQINRYSDLKNEFKDAFLSHPNYPSLFAITDSLDLLLIENAAIRVTKEQIVDLPQNFLAYFREELILVEKFKDYVRINTIKKGIVKMAYEKFLLDWNGVIVAIEPNTEFDNEKLRIELSWLKYFLPFCLMAGLSFYYNTYDVYSIIFLITAILGATVSTFIIQQKLGFKNAIISKFCNLSTNSSCSDFINNAKKSRWIGFSDLPLLFFSSSFIAILIQPLDSVILIGFLSMSSIPVIICSIWIQKFEIKKWCIMCLAVSFLIFLQSIIWFASDLFTLSFNFQNIFPFLFSALLLLPIWLFVKPLIESIQNTENSAKELKKFKRNYSLLNFLSKRVPQKAGFNDLKGLDFGNRNASIKLSIVISPSCVHCHTVVQEAFDLISKFPDRIFLNVLFNINIENNTNPYKAVVERLLMIHRATPEKTFEALSDWYFKKLGLRQWLKRWPIDVIGIMISQEIQKQYDWCEKNNFNYTPVKIVNEKIFPTSYDVSEIKYFLNDFAEENPVLEKTA